jgi:hypothetical protein
MPCLQHVICCSAHFRPCRCFRHVDKLRQSVSHLTVFTLTDSQMCVSCAAAALRMRGQSMCIVWLDHSHWTAHVAITAGATHTTHPWMQRLSSANDHFHVPTTWKAKLGTHLGCMLHCITASMYRIWQCVPCKTCQRRLVWVCFLSSNLLEPVALLYCLCWFCG